MTTDELLRDLQTSDVVIFGAGFVADMFYQGLALHGLASKVRCFVVSHTQEGRLLHGRPVLSVECATLSDDTLLCVAVHESAMTELQGVLEACRARSVWVYPHLFGLLYGTPVRTEAALPLTQLLSMQEPGAYWLVVRYAAIRDYLERKPSYPRTRDLYLRALAIHCGEATALRRCQQMEELAESVSRQGIRQDCPVRIDEQGRIIDGLHRVACAAYLRIEGIPAVMYHASPIYDTALGERNRLPEHVLLKSGFSTEDIRTLREARDELFTSRER